MKDLLLSARRGVECFLDPVVALVLFGTGAAWTVVNWVAGWLLLGPALVALFRIALKALRGEEPRFKEDNLAVLEDLPTSLVAGILFALPFKLWAMLDDLGDVVASLVPQGDPVLSQLVTPGIPVTASAALFVHFAFHIFTFPLLAERHCGVVEAAEASRELADRPGRAGSRLHGLGRHLLATAGVLVLILVAARAWYVHSGAGGLFTMVIGPAAVAVLAAWYLHCTGEMRTPASTAAEPPQDE